MSSEYTWTFTTQAASVLAPVLIPPTVVAVTPSNGETNVPYNVRHITAEFSAAMDGISLGATSFTLSKGDLAQKVTAVSIDYADKVADFTIGANLSPNTLYTATITTEAKSAEGAALASDYVWTFTTGAIPDTTRPTVLITSPSNNDFNVSITKTITATFSEAMKSTSITAPGTFTVKETNSTTANIGGVVSYDIANKVASFNPTADLADNTDYTAIITTAAQDFAGNAILKNYNWSFTTAQNIPPKVIAVTPENNETDVSTNIKHITAEFSVVMDNTTLSTTSFTLSKGDPAQQVTAVSVEYANRVADLTLASDANLSENTLYTATITTDAKDENGVALLNDYIWTFTTGTNPDVLPPEVLSTSPIDGAIDVAITKIITATFSESMKSLSITAPGTFTLMETSTSNNVAGNVSYSVINQIASFNPTSDLAPGTNYTASITTAAQDLAGNAMLQDHNWTFATANEVQPPLVPLGRAATFGIAATKGVTNTSTAPNTQIDGDVVLNPTAECNAVAVDNAGGFGNCGGFAPTINGEVITPSYPDTTTAQNVTDDLRAAYLSITPANMPSDSKIAAPTTLGEPEGAALVEGDNLFYPGVYESITSILVTGVLTLDAQGDPDATFVFQSASTVGSMPGTEIKLINGAKASNVYWQVGSDVTLQTNTIWNGNIFAYRDISMVTGASSCGRLFAGAFTDGLFVFDSNRVSVPGNSSAPATCQ